MKSLLLFLSLSCLGAAADKAPPPPLCPLEFDSFSLGVNGTTKEPYCILSLNGRPLEHLSVVSISKERPFDLSVTDSTGKTSALNHVLIEPAWEKEWNREEEFHLRFSLSEWPSEHAEWLRIRGNVSVVCIKASSLDPVEVDLIHPGETEIPVVGNDIPQSDIADPARTETLILFVEKWEGKEEEGFQWKFSLGHRDSFRYCGMELEDMHTFRIFPPRPNIRPPFPLSFSSSGTMLQSSSCLPAISRCLRARKNPVAAHRAEIAAPPSMASGEWPPRTSSERFSHALAASPPR